MIIIRIMIIMMMLIIITIIYAVKTSDAYTLRLFCVGFTKKRQNQIKKTSYAQTQQVKVYL